MFNFFAKAALAEKRKAEEEAAEVESSKRQHLEVEGDVSSETIAQILTTITDPNEMIGPDVSSLTCILLFPVSQLLDIPHILWCMLRHLHTFTPTHPHTHMHTYIHTHTHIHSSSPPDTHVNSHMHAHV